MTHPTPEETQPNLPDVEGVVETIHQVRDSIENCLDLNGDEYAAFMAGFYQLEREILQRFTQRDEQHQERMSEMVGEMVLYYEDHYADSVFPWSVADTVKAIVQKYNVKL